MKKSLVILLLLAAILLSVTSVAAKPPVDKVTGNATIPFNNYEFPATGFLTADFVAMRDTEGTLKGELTIDPYPIWAPIGTGPTECLYVDGNEAWIGVPYWCNWCSRYHGLYLYVQDNGEGANEPDDMMALYSFASFRPSEDNRCVDQSFRMHLKSMAVPITEGNVQMH